MTGWQAGGSTQAILGKHKQAQLYCTALPLQTMNINLYQFAHVYYI